MSNSKNILQGILILPLSKLSGNSAARAKSSWTEHSLYQTLRAHSNQRVFSQDQIEKFFLKKTEFRELPVQGFSAKIDEKGYICEDEFEQQFAGEELIDTAPAKLEWRSMKWQRIANAR